MKSKILENIIETMNGIALFAIMPTYIYIMAGPRPNVPQLNPEDKKIHICTELVGFPTIKNTYGIDRKGDGSIDEYYDTYAAFGGKSGNQIWTPSRPTLEPTD